MIESKTLGSAAGIQRQDVIDNSESVSLPSLNNGVITGRFKRGRMDKPFIVTPDNYKALLGYDPSNKSYLAIEDTFKRGVTGISVLRVGGFEQVVIGCQTTPSAWSNPITFAMVNKPTGNGGISVRLGLPDFDNGSMFSIGGWIDLSIISTIEEFFEKVNEKGSYDDPYQLGVKSLGDGSASIRLEHKEVVSSGELGEFIPLSIDGLPLEVTPVDTSTEDEKVNFTYAAQKGASFYVYDENNIGNNAESFIYLANAFTDNVTFVSCEAEAIDNGEILE